MIGQGRAFDKPSVTILGPWVDAQPYGRIERACAKIAGGPSVEPSFAQPKNCFLRLKGERDCTVPVTGVRYGEIVENDGARVVSYVPVSAGSTVVIPLRGRPVARNQPPRPSHSARLAR